MTTHDYDTCPICQRGRVPVGHENRPDQTPEANRPEHTLEDDPEDDLMRDLLPKAQHAAMHTPPPKGESRISPQYAARLVTEILIDTLAGFREGWEAELNRRANRVANPERPNQ